MARHMKETSRRIFTREETSSIDDVVVFIAPSFSIYPKVRCCPYLSMKRAKAEEGSFFDNSLILEQYFIN